MTSQPPEPPGPAPEWTQPPEPPERRYDKRVLWTTAALTVVLLVVLTISMFGVFPLNLLVPLLVLITSLVMMARAKDARSRSIALGMLIGFGLGLLITAGTCAALVAAILSSE